MVIQPLFEPLEPQQLAAAVRDYVRRERMFRPSARVLVAVSGGPDSVALLHLLHRFAPEWGLSLAVAHFDHGLRGEASREDARFVAQLAADLGLPCHIGQGDVQGAARAQKVSVQMAARRLRLNFLRELKKKHRYDRLALGHTADDQVELFFLRLFRGAGPEGLKGMWPLTPEGLVRPLLAVGKEALLAWLAHEKLAYRVDGSNLQRRYLRNRIRLELLPLLAQEYNPRLKAGIWRLMALLQEEETFLVPLVEQAWREGGRWLSPHCAALSVAALQGLHPALQKRLLRHCLGLFQEEQEITSAQVNSLLALAQGKRSGGILRCGPCQVARAGPELHFFRSLPAPEMKAVFLAGPGTVASPAGWRLEAREVQGPPPSPGSPIPHLIQVDLDKTPFPLTLRPVRPGDRFRPAGGPGTKKVADFLVDAKIPRWLRPYVPLVTSGDTVIWLPGLRLAETVRPTSRTARLLELSLLPQTPEAARLWELLLAFAPKPEKTA